MKKDKIEDIVFPLIFLLIPLILFGKILFSGEMLYGTDWLNGAYMKREFIINMMRNFNIFPLWNPNFFAGIPTGEGFLGDIFYPITFILKLFLPLYVVWTLSFIIHPFLAGIGTYLFIKRKMKNKYVALFAGIAYMLTGVIISETYAGHDGRIMVACYFPLLIYFLDRALFDKRFYYYLFASIISAFMFLSGHVQSSYYAIMLALFYVSYNHINIDYKHKFRNYTFLISIIISFLLSFINANIGFVFFIVLIISLPVLLDKKIHKQTIRIYLSLFVFILFTALLSAVQYLPLLRFVPHTARGISRGYAYATSWAMGITEILDLFFPGISGINIQDINNYWGVNAFKLHLRYIGIIPIFLALGSLLKRKKNNINLSFSIMLLISLIVALGSATPIYHIFYNLFPYFNKFRAPELIFFICSFSIIVLASDFLKENNNKKPIFISGIIIVSFGLITILFPTIIINIFHSFVQGLNYPPQIIQQKIINLNNAVNSIKGTGLINSLIIIFVFLLLYKIKIPRKYIIIIFAIITLIDLTGRLNKYIVGVPSPDKYFKKDGVVSILEQDTTLYRVLPLMYRNDNYLSLFGINSIQANHPSPFADYQKFIGNENSVMFTPELLLQKPNRLSLLNVKYMITPLIPEDTIGYDARSKMIIKQYNDLFEKLHFIRYKKANDKLILISKKYLPRVFMVNDYILVKNMDEAIKIIDKNNINLQKTVLLYKDVNIRKSENSLTYTITNLNYSPNIIEFDIQANKDGIIVVLDQYYKAWKVKIDNMKTDVLKANGMFRGIKITKGKHHIKLYYDKTLQIISALISLISFLIIILLFFIEKYIIKRFYKKE